MFVESLSLSSILIITNDNVIIDDNGNTVGIVNVNRNYNGFDNDVNIDRYNCNDIIMVMI